MAGVHEGARGSAVEHKQAGETTGIRYEDAQGRWLDEVSDGDDRPTTHVVDRG